MNHQNRPGDSIGPKEVVTFLGESSLDSNSVGNKWYKVKTQQGEVGWVSVNIVEEV